MRRIRGLVYRLGFRPRPGSIFYSPSRDWMLAGQAAMRVAAEELRRCHGRGGPCDCCGGDR